MNGRGPRQVVRHELVRRTARVARVADLTAHIRRVTLTGSELAGFTSVGPDDHVKLILPTPSGEPAMRDYTPAAFRPHGDGRDTDLPELDIDFVVHGDGGPASAWAAAAQPGDTVTIGGPRGSRLPPEGWQRFVLIADESALPSLGRWVRMAAGVGVLAYVQSEDPRVLSYPLPPELTVERIGIRSDDALQRLQSLDLTDSYVWAAGEATALIPVRRYLRREVELGKDQVKVDGYWKRGVAELDHHAPLDPEDPED